jgi:hypothetical protein
MFLAGSGKCMEGRREAARATGEAQASVNAHFYAAVAYAICADRPAAIRHSLKALEGGAVSDLRSNPDLRAVREDPGIKARLRKAGRS